MRILRGGIVTIFFIMVVLVSFAYAAEAKIGVFNFDQIMSDSKMGKSAKSKLEKKHNDLKAVLEKKKNALENMDAKLEKDRMVMGKDKYNQKKYEIQKMAIDFKELERKSTDEMRQLRQELIQEINKEVVEVLDKIGKKEKYTIIIEKNIAGTAYYDSKIDLTNRIIKELNKK